MTDTDRTMNVALRVDVRTRKDGDYYTDEADVLRHVKRWIGDGLYDRDDLAEVTVTELPPDVPEEPTEPDHPAARALASYIESHGMSTVMAAMRYLGLKVTFDIQPDVCLHGPERHGPEAGCVECPCRSTVGHDLGKAALSNCAACQDVISWIDCPTGGWWAHEIHPEDGHDARPTEGPCPAGLLPRDSAASVERCVVHNGHRVHRTANGEPWTEGEEV